MSLSSVGKRYAKAVFSLLEAKDYQKSLNFLQNFESAFQTGQDLDLVLQDPKIKTAKKKELLFKILEEEKALPVFKKTYSLMLQNGRAVVYPFFHSHLIGFLQQALGLQPAELITASPIAKEALEKFTNEISQKKNKKFLITAKVDPQILGGMIFRDGNLEYDQSLASKMEELRERIYSAT